MSTRKSAKSETAKSEVRIAVADQLRELTIETSLDRGEVLTMVSKALTSSTPLVLVDTRGRQYVVPATKIGSIEIGDIAERRVGFASA